jgi:predicted NAD/FAD-binding protein
LVEQQGIAIIGGGIAGLTAAHLLHDEHDITLFEKSERIGGNAYTLRTRDGQEVDIAVAAFGKYSYTNFFKLLRELKIETVASFGMDPLHSFGIGLSYCNLDTGERLHFTPSLRGLVGQKFKILKPSLIKDLFLLARGLKKAGDLFDSGKLDGLTVEDMLVETGWTGGNVKLIYIGGLCLMSSMYCDDVLNAPAAFFAEKLKKYDDLLPPKAAISVRFTKERTRAYIDALSAGFRDRIVLHAEIRTVLREGGEVTLVMRDGAEEVFDGVIFACNADQALGLLEKPTDMERKLLGAWRYTEGKVVVHTDHAYFPKRELMEGYTFLYRNKGRYIESSISGSLWALPGVSRQSRLISTQHPNFPIEKDDIVFEKVFRTPIFDFKSCSTVKELPLLNGRNNTYYCGSHFGFGIHEDAVTSAIEVARKLRARLQQEA